MKFQNYYKLVPLQFCIIADLESAQCRDDNYSHGPKTLSGKKHMPIAVGAKRVAWDSKYDGTLQTFIGQGCMQKFLKYLEKQVKYMEKVMSKRVPMIFDEEARRKFKNATECYMCKRKLQRREKYRDHNHLNGAYRWCLCMVCNLVHASVKKSCVLPVIFHNGSGYDWHFVVQQVRHLQGKKMSFLAKNSEKLLMFRLGNLHFIDSMKFMQAGLSQLGNNLKSKGVDKFIHTRKLFTQDKQFELMTRKGVFPHDIVTSLKMLSKCRSLPDKNFFYDKLNECHISDADYEHAQKVWKVFRCKTLKDYMKVYLQADCLIPADVFQEFRRTCIEYYALDPCRYISAPQLAMDAFLRSSGVKLELLTDVDMYNFFEASVRGGFSSIVHRYVKANNPRLSNYDPNVETSFLLYLDFNSLYPYCMKMSLPWKDFTWLSRKEIDQLDLSELETDNRFGYFLEVTLSYPQHLHDRDQDFPLCPETKKIDPSLLSPLTKDLCKKFGMSLSTQCSAKLIADFSTKCKYVTHYKNLLFYLDRGMKLEKIHRVVKFRQKRYLSDFIDFNTKKRAEASNQFEVMFFKILLNSIFGKFLERKRGRINFHLCQDGEKFTRLSSQPNFKSFKIVNDDLVTVQTAKTKITLDSFVPAGATTLDLSKFFMQSFQQRFARRLFGPRTRMCFTDTDSLLLQIFCEEGVDLYDDILYSVKDYFDFSNYDPQHPLYNTLHKRQPGYMKDVSGSKLISEFVGLKPKMYSYIEADDCKKAAKGVKLSRLRCLRHEDFVNSLLQCTRTEERYSSIVSKSHQVYTVEQRKIALSPVDFKRYMVSATETLPYFHYKINGRKRKNAED